MCVCVCVCVCACECVCVCVCYREWRFVIIYYYYYLYRYTYYYPHLPQLTREKTFDLSPLSLQYRGKANPPASAEHRGGIRFTQPASAGQRYVRLIPPSSPEETEDMCLIPSSSAQQRGDVRLCHLPMLSRQKKMSRDDVPLIPPSSAEQREDVRLTEQRIEYRLSLICFKITSHQASVYL